MLAYTDLPTRMLYCACIVNKLMALQISAMVGITFCNYCYQLVNHLHCCCFCYGIKWVVSRITVNPLSVVWPDWSFYACQTLIDWRLLSVQRDQNPPMHGWMVTCSLRSVFLAITCMCIDQALEEITLQLVIILIMKVLILTLKEKVWTACFFLKLLNDGCRMKYSIYKVSCDAAITLSLAYY